MNYDQDNEDDERYMASLPRVFKGCQWDAGWSYDAPCVVYYPMRYCAFGVGGNSYEIDEMVEGITMSISEGVHHDDGGIYGETKARGFSVMRMRRRKNAWHVRITGHWQRTATHELEFIVDKREEHWGPFPKEK